MTGRPIKPLPPEVPPQEEQTKWVAYFLRRTIHNRDTTITQLAHALAVDRSTIYHWFQGKLPVTMIRLIYWIYNDSNPQDKDSLPQRQRHPCRRRLLDGKVPSCGTPPSTRCKSSHL